MKYTCPMHPEVSSGAPGKCPKCQMALVEKGAESAQKNSYTPLFIIIGVILLASTALSLQRGANASFSLEYFMTDFMAGFFLVFSGFKLLDLKGFKDGYSTYDLLARRFPMYGYIYPFIELLLGLMFLVRFELFWANLMTVVVMGFSGLGVLDRLSKKQKIQCACLGTVIKLPLSSVTLVEDFGMAAMAAVMLFLI